MALGDRRPLNRELLKTWLQRHEHGPMITDDSLGGAPLLNARLQVIKLYYQGWHKGSISRFLRVSRPTVDAWIQRFEAEQFAGLADKKRGPKHPRKVWLPLMWVQAVTELIRRP
jgi:hypothetical protein